MRQFPFKKPPSEPSNTHLKILPPSEPLDPRLKIYPTPHKLPDGNHLCPPWK